MPIYFKDKKVFLVIFLLLVTQFSACAQEDETLKRFEFSHPGMGSLFKIICYGSDEVKVSQTAGYAFSLIDSLNFKMSDYLPDSELMKLSRTSGQGLYVDVSNDLFTIINESLYWSEISDGVFDITVGAYSQLWRRAGRKQKLPEPEQLKKASSVVDYRLIKLDNLNQSVLLSNPDMQLDLGGIAKGYAVDRIFTLFKENGFNHFLIDGGGDIRVGDSPPGTNGWKIALDNRLTNDSILFLSNRAVATSGDIYRFVEIDTIRFSHIIDPATGYGITVPRTVTVTAPTCTQADVIASILSITGPVKGFDFLNKLSGVTALIVKGLPEGEMKSYRYPTQ